MGSNASSSNRSPRINGARYIPGDAATNANLNSGATGRTAKRCSMSSDIPTLFSEGIGTTRFGTITLPPVTAADTMTFTPHLRHSFPWPSHHAITPIVHAAFAKAEEAQAEAKPSLTALALPPVILIQSHLKPGQSRAFRPRWSGALLPVRNIIQTVYLEVIQYH
ncbi:hypothetical protein BDR07DRAFT_1381285 [Suillus spraguei]|nr:hypothetical protein BDR07DRAFT_1381285 [Suillus spraguei]